MNQEVHINYPENVLFNCSKCGLCCGDTSKKTRRVLLPLLDAQRIVAITNQPIGTFADAVSGKEPYVYEMKKDAKGQCMFLKDNECTIYENRPLICRFYPFELQTNSAGVYTFVPTDECPGISSCEGKTVKRLGRRYFEDLLKLAEAQLNDGCSSTGF